MLGNEMVSFPKADKSTNAAEHLCSILIQIQVATLLNAP